jgi:ribonucleoside-diphosphate reductase alpha chain
MHVIKRNGETQPISFDKILYRLKKLQYDNQLDPLNNISVDVITQQVIQDIYDSISTTEIDELSARIAISMSINNTQYGDLASRILVSNLHKKTTECFSDTMEKLYFNENNEEHSPLISKEIIEIVRENKDVLNFAINYSRDYLFDFFGFKTLEKSYLFKIKNKTGKWDIIERPQHMWMRVSLGLHKNNIEKAIETYNLMSQFYFTHATPTLFNAGSPRPALSSCFHEDTIVATVNRGPIKIKDVEIGDSVITHLGNIKKVSQLHKNLLNERKFYNIDISKTAPIKVTSNHKLRVINYSDIQKEKSKDKTLCKNKDCMISRKNGDWFSKTKVISEPHWKSVEELVDGDFVCIPNKITENKLVETLDLAELNSVLYFKNNKYNMVVEEETIKLTTNFDIYKKRHHNLINRFWKIDNDFAKFIGIFYGDGHIITRNNVHYGMGVTIHSLNKNLVEFCETFGKRLFGINPTIHYVKNQNITQILYNSKYIGDVFNHLFGKGFNGKKVWHKMFSWDTELITNLLEGLITTDGCVSKGNVVTLQMSNVNFMREFYYLLRNNNIDVSYGVQRHQKNGTKNFIQMNIPSNCINKDNINKYYTDNRMSVKSNSNRNKNSAIEVDGFKYLKFKGKTEINKDLPEYVYTLGVEDDHSYNVGGIIAENCYLLGTLDSMDGIYKCLSDCAIISKNGGGIGFHIGNIRGNGSYIKGTNGKADGIVKMLRVFNETARYANQGSKRNGSFAAYLEPHHCDIFDFLELKKNTGDENTKCRDLFYALWIPDIFMKCVEDDSDWYLMDPNVSKGLTDVYGEEYEKMYHTYVKDGKFIKKVKARELWNRVLVAQIETGMPYILYKDHVNRKTNQKNIGTIKSSNLCAEILLYSDDKEYGVCNIATLGLPKYVEKTSSGYIFNYNKLFEVTKIVTRNMNNVIDYNYYPVPETRISNMKHRPIAVGAQGLANVFFKMGIPFESEEACEINKKIFETIYYACVFESNQLAKIHGPYETFKGSPASKGILQFDMWGEYDLSGLWDWASLREDVKKYGLRNSMLTALPPTASTSQILGNFESFEPITNNYFIRSTLSGDYPVINKYMAEELQKINMWNDSIIERIVYHRGSIQNIPEIPSKIKEVFKTVWECSQKKIMNMSRDRGVFVDHTQSLNLYIKDINLQKLSSAHFHGWNIGLKTSMYYCRLEPVAKAQQFTVSVETQKAEQKLSEILACSRENPESCLACSG